jgi:ABC-type sulfate transport system permease component
MDIWIFVILSILLVWIIFYRYCHEEWNAAADRIKSKRLRTAVKVFLKVSYVVSIIAVVAGYVYQIVSLFSKKEDKA